MTNFPGCNIVMETCKWVVFGQIRLCEKPVKEDGYCTRHLYYINVLGRNPPKACKICGRGVRCDYRVCQHCGGEVVRMRLNIIQKRSKKAFKLVLDELTTKLEEVL